MNKKKLLITLFLTCIAVYSTFIAVSIVTNGNKQDATLSSINSYLHDDTYKFSYTTVSSITTGDVTGFTIKNGGKEYRYEKSEKGWECSSKSAITDAVSVSYALNTLADIKIYQGNGIEVLDATNENIENCGLDGGFEITLTFKSGETKTFAVGNYLKFGSAYYFSCGDGKIYTVLNRFTSNILSLVE